MTGISKDKRLIALAGLVLFVAVSRLFPHPPNFSPVAALALFGGASFVTRKAAFIVPILAMLISDIGLELTTGFGFHALMPVVYFAFALTVMIGMWVGKHLSVGSVVGGTLVASGLFFAVTNFAVWARGDLYPLTFDGLIACYIAAIPFFQNTLIGNFVYVGVLFGGWALAENRFPVLMRPKTVTA